MNKRDFFKFAGSLLGAGMIVSTAQAADAKKPHKLMLAIDGADPQLMRMALGNAQNAKKYYDSKNEAIEVEVVTYGPGIDMLREDKSPVKDMLDETKKFIPNLALSMCNNAKTAAEKREGHEITPLPGVKVVPAGIVRVMELQEAGWSYVKP